MGESAVPLIVVTAEQRAAVTARLRDRDLPARVRERLEMVKAAALGQDLAAIERWSGRSARTVRRWLGRFVAGGVAALADAARPGRRGRTRGIGRRSRRSPRRPRTWGCRTTCGPRPG